MKSEKYSPEEKRKAQQLVASTDTPKLGMKGRRPLKRRKSKYNCENIPSNSKKLSPGSRQTVLSEYFTSPNSKETTACIKTNHDDNNGDDASAQTMVNVPQLLSQLLRAHVVLKRVLLPVKETPIKEPHQPITIVNPDNTRVVQRYCHKCKIVELDRSNVSKRKICRKCNNLLIYLCSKCNVGHFIQFKHMKKHHNRCGGNVNGESTKDVLLDSVNIYSCADCSFITTHEKTISKHIKHTNHSLFEGEMVFKADQIGDEDPTETFLVKEDIDSSKKGIKRYCPKCKKVVSGHRTINEDTCRKCNTRLLFKCGKCKFKCNFYKTLYYHIKVKCYANVYRCPKCNYTTSLWHIMHNHLKAKKCVKIAKK